MYVRHCAWLMTVPDKEKQTRLDRLQATGSPLAELPELDGLQYLAEYLMEVGPVESTGMGPAPLSYREIASWSEATDTHLSPWDAQMLRHLSRVYVRAAHDAKEPSAPAPYRDAMNIEQQRQSVVAGFKALARRGKRNG